MNEAIKQKWVAALRSGEYEQTLSMLRNSEGFCCLGFLCDLYSKATGVDWFHSADDEYAMHGNDNTLPLEVRQWAQLADEFGGYVEIETDEDGMTDPYPVDVSLTELNDSWGYDFKLIAKVIEQQL